MSQRSITQQFSYLGAPLVNTRWSWGGSSSNAVVLRIWQDRCEKRNDRIYARITHHDKYMDYDALGWKERLVHVEEIKSGKPTYLIMCRVADPDTSPREIASFDAKTVFVGGELVEYDEDLWIELKDRLPVKQAKSLIQA